MNKPFCRNCGTKKEMIETGLFNEETGEKEKKEGCPNDKCPEKTRDIFSDFGKFRHQRTPWECNHVIVPYYPRECSPNDKFIPPYTVTC